MSEFEKPLRSPFSIQFVRSADPASTLDKPVVCFDTKFWMSNSDVQFIRTKVSKDGADDPAIVKQIKIDHHNKIVGLLSTAIRKKLKID